MAEFNTETNKFVDSLRKADNQVRTHVGNLEKQLKASVDVTKSTKERNLAHKESLTILKRLDAAEEKYHQTQVKIQKSISERIRIDSKLNNLLDSSTRRSIQAEEDWLDVNKRVREEHIRLGRAIREVESPLRRFQLRIRAVGNDVNKTERRLALMGRAMLGLAIASVIVFMQSFISIITVLGAEAIAAAGSITYLAATLGGTLVAGIAQALPMVGLLVAAFQRLSLVNDALQEQQRIKQQSAGQEAQQAGQAVQNAEQIADAQRGVLEAQQNLTDARKEAKDELQDLILAEREAELAARRASLSLLESRQAMRDTVQEGDIGGIMGAELDVADARLGKRRSRIDLSRARQQANSARRGGVGGMDRVVDATKALEDAQRNLARAHKDAATEAQNQSAAEENLAFALEQLTPTEKDLMRNIGRFKERFKKVFNPITDILIESFDEGLDSVEKMLFDNRIVGGFRNLAKAMADSFGEVTKLLTNERSTRFWTDVLAEGKKNLEPITDIVKNLWVFFRNITEAAFPVFRRLLEDIVDLTGKWAESTKDTKEVTEFFQTGLKHLRAWGRLLGGIFDLWSELMGVSGDSAIHTLDDLTDRFHNMADGIRENQTEAAKFFNDSSEGFGALLDIVGRIGLAFIHIFQSGGLASLEAFSRILDNIIIPAFEDATIAIGRVVQWLDSLLSIGIIGFLARWTVTIGITLGQVKLLGGAVLLLLKPLGALIRLIGALALAGAKAAGLTGLAGFLKAIGEINKAFASGGIIAGLSALIKKIGGLRNALKLLVVGGGVVGLVIGALSILGDTLGIFSSDNEEAAASVDQVTSSLEAQKDALDALRDAHLSEREAELRVADAKDRLQDATKAVTVAERKHGKQSEEAKDARREEAHATIDLTRAERDLKRLRRDQPDEARQALIDNNIALEDARSRTVKYAEEVRKANEDIQEFSDHLETTAEGTNEYQYIEGKLNQAIQRRNANQVTLNQAVDDYTEAQARSRRLTEKVTESQDDQTVASRKLRRGLGGLIDTLFGTGKQSSELGRVIKEVTNKVLTAFGVDDLKFNIPSVVKVAGSIFNNPGGFLGGLLGGQTGGWMGHPGQRGPDDRIIKVAGGEAVLTGHHQAPVEMAMAYGKAAGIVPYGSLDEMFARDNRMHMTAPGFQRGGRNRSGIRVPEGGFPDADGALSGLDALAWFLSKKFGLTLTSGKSSHSVTTSTGNISDHSWGGAIDVSNGITTPQMDAAHAFLRSTLGGGGEFSTNYSGGAIKQMLYKTMLGGNHFNHIHVALVEAYARDAKAVINALASGNVRNLGAAGLALGGVEIPRIKIGGPDGPLKEMLQAQSDRLRKAANRKIASSAPDLAGGLGGFSSAISPHQMPAGSLGKQAMRSLLRKAGLPDIFYWIGGNESNLNPNAKNASGASGLFQIMMPLHQALVAKYGGNVFNPMTNALVAAALYRDSGLTPWAASKYEGAWGGWGQNLGNPAFRRGGRIPQFDNGGIVPGPIGSPQTIGAHGGEIIVPAHKMFQRGGFTKGLRNARQQLQRISGTGVGNIDRLTKLLMELLRDGGILDDIGLAIEEFIADQSRRLIEWTYKIRGKMVSQVRTNIQIANRELDALEDQGRLLNKELDEIGRAIKITKRKLSNAEKQKDRKRIKTALENLQNRQDALGDTLAQNLQDRFAAQAAIFDQVMERFGQRAGMFDLRQRIAELQGEISGTVDSEKIKELIQGRIGVLEDQRKAIQRQLNQAVRRGDRERARELRQALLENQIAILENTQALNDNTNTVKEIFSFNSSAWQMFRVAIFNGMGGLLPNYQIPQLHTGGNVTKDGLFNLKAGEAVISADQNGKTNVIYITEPMEVADPTALSNAISFKLKTSKVD